jgi:hypothetical protein
MTDQESTLSYHAERQCSAQWRGFLQALSAEFEGQLEQADLRGIMSRVGERFAKSAALGDCQTLDDLELEVNRVWFNRDWGWVKITEAPTHLAIHHHCAPLAAAFGDGALNWAPAFLEGAYQEWFSGLGAAPDVRVRQAGGGAAAVAGAPLEFRLAR